MEANKTFLAALGASCASCGAMITTPSVAALPGTCRTRLEISRSFPLSSFTATKLTQIACSDPYPFHTRSIPEASHATTHANMKGDSIRTTAAAAAAAPRTTTIATSATTIANAIATNSTATLHYITTIIYYYCYIATISTATSATIATTATTILTISYYY